MEINLLSTIILLLLEIKASASITPRMQPTNLPVSFCCSVLQWSRARLSCVKPHPLDRRRKSDPSPTASNYFNTSSTGLYRQPRVISSVTVCSHTANKIVIYARKLGPFNICMIKYVLPLTWHCSSFTSGCIKKPLTANEFIIKNAFILILKYLISAHKCLII